MTRAWYLLEDPRAPDESERWIPVGDEREVRLSDASIEQMLGAWDRGDLETEECVEAIVDRGADALDDEPDVWATAPSAIRERVASKLDI